MNDNQTATGDWLCHCYICGFEEHADDQDDAEDILLDHGETKHPHVNKDLICSAKDHIAELRREPAELKTKEQSMKSLTNDDQTATTILCTECCSHIPFDNWAMLNDPNGILHAKVKAHVDAYHPDCEYSLHYLYSDTQNRIKKVEVHVFRQPSDKNPDPNGAWLCLCHICGFEHSADDVNSATNLLLDHARKKHSNINKELTWSTDNHVVKLWKELDKRTEITCDECGMRTWLFDHVRVIDEIDDGKIERSVKNHINHHHPDHAYQIYYGDLSNDGKGVAVDHARIHVLHPMKAQKPDDDPKFDPVSHPKHYDKNGVECIDWIETCLTPEEFRGYLKGNSLKYLWRNEHKGNPVQDLGKAGWYVDKLRTFSNSDIGKDD